MCSPGQPAAELDNNDLEGSSPSAVAEEEEEDDGENSNSSSAQFNPEAEDSDIDTDELERLRRDAIGDTMYSKRFVLNQLLLLAERKFELTDEFQTNLCALWDMTSERDVVIYLNEHRAIELFSEVITLVDEDRLTEIVVGMVGNMCVVKEVVEKNAMHIMAYFKFISCTDTLTLMQLMRLYQCVFTLADVDGTWLREIALVPDFLNCLNNIFANSTNKTLLESTFWAVEKMLNKLSPLENATGQVAECPNFSDFFVQHEFVESMFIGYEYLEPKPNFSDDFSEVKLEDMGQVISCFFHIHCILMQFYEKSREVYESFMPKLVESINEQLDLFQNYTRIKKSASWFVEDMVLSACDIHIYNMCFGYVIDMAGFKKMLNIWDILQTEMEKYFENPTDFEEDDNPLCYDEICSPISKFIATVIDRCDEEQLCDMLMEQDESTVGKMCAFYADEDNLLNHRRAEKLEEALQKIRTQKEEHPIVVNGLNDLTTER